MYKRQNKTKQNQTTLKEEATRKTTSDIKPSVKDELCYRSIWQCSEVLSATRSRSYNIGLIVLYKDEEKTNRHREVAHSKRVARLQYVHALGDDHCSTQTGSLPVLGRIIIDRRARDSRRTSILPVQRRKNDSITYLSLRVHRRWLHAGVVSAYLTSTDEDTKVQPYNKPTWDQWRTGNDERRCTLKERERVDLLYPLDDVLPIV